MVGVARVPGTVSSDADHRNEEHNPVQPVHANHRENSASNATAMTNQRKTKK
jgi:hypothetical protein